MRERVVIHHDLPLTDQMAQIIEASVADATGRFHCCEVLLDVTPCTGLFCSFPAPEVDWHGYVVHMAMDHAEGCPELARAQTRQAAREGLN